GVRALPAAARVPRAQRRATLRRRAAAARHRPRAARAAERPAPRRALARARAARGRRGLRGARAHPRPRRRDPARRAARTAHGRGLRAHARARQRRAAHDPRPRRRGRHGEAHRRLPERMILGFIDAQTLVDAVSLGAIYALMAVGIGLVFGVLRLINFAYGQLIMAGAYTLAYTSAWPVFWSVVACFGVVIALSRAVARVVFRPLRDPTPAVMLVTTFAISFMLQAIALVIDLRDGFIGETAASIAPLNQVVTIRGVDVHKVTFVAIGVTAGILLALALLLRYPPIGRPLRAAAPDLPTPRLLGVRANRVIGFAVFLSALVAATVSVLMTVQNPFVSPDFALYQTIVV